MSITPTVATQPTSALRWMCRLQQGWYSPPPARACNYQKICTFAKPQMRVGKRRNWVLGFVTRSHLRTAGGSPCWIPPHDNFLRGVSISISSIHCEQFVWIYHSSWLTRLTLHLLNGLLMCDPEWKKSKPAHQNARVHTRDQLISICLCRQGLGAVEDGPWPWLASARARARSRSCARVSTRARAHLRLYFIVRDYWQLIELGEWEMGGEVRTTLYWLCAVILR